MRALVRMVAPAPTRAVLAIALVVLASTVLSGAWAQGNSTAPPPASPPTGAAPGGTATAGNATGSSAGAGSPPGGAGSPSAGGSAAAGVTVDFYEFEKPPSFVIEPSGVTLIPGENVTVVVHNIGQIQHNFYVGDGGSVAKIDPLIDPGKSATVTFQVPATGVTVYYCNVVGHREAGMQGNITLKGAAVPGAAASAAEQVAGISKLGVNYYAYWVGVIAFIVLFAVLAVTFFVLRYGESGHWTDWRDRPARKPAEGEAAKRPIGTWIVLLLVVIVALVAAAQVASIVR
jgi:plastocyanin